MTLLQLANFVRIAELQSLSKAALVVGVAQPALSRQLRALEAEMGSPLFVRHAWGVALTPAGDTLLARARRLLTETEHARDAVQALAKRPTGRISLGVPASLGTSLLPQLATLLRQKYPDLRPVFVDGFSAALHERVVSGDLDMAILYSDRSIGPLPMTPLLTENLMLVGPVDADVKPAPAAEMLRERALILPSRPNRLRLLVDEAAFQPSTPPLEVDSLPAMIALVVSGAGFTVLPYSAVADEAARGVVGVWPLNDPPLARTLVLVRATERHASPAVQVVEEEIVALIRALAERLRWRALSAAGRRPHAKKA